MRYNTNRLGVVKTLLFSAWIIFLPFVAQNDTRDVLFADAFAGQVDENLFIGVLVADHPPVPQRKALVVYLCDGADVSTWLFEEAIGDTVVLEDADTRVEMSLDEESLTGVIERAGEAPQVFVAEFATGDAGLYRAVETIDGQDYVGGWVVLNSLEQRGAITLGGQVIENPTLDLTTGEAETSVGTFGTNCFRDPRTGDRICRWPK